MASGRRSKQIKRGEELKRIDHNERATIDAALAGRTLEITRTTTSFEQFSGPLPPPEILAKYDQACPGSARVILEMAQAQSTHRQYIEKKVVDGNVDAQKRGQFFAFVLAILSLGVAVTFGILKMENAASIVVGTTVIGLVSLFITGRIWQMRERAKKDKSRTPPGS